MGDVKRQSTGGKGTTVGKGVPSTTLLPPILLKPATALLTPSTFKEVEVYIFTVTYYIFYSCPYYLVRPCTIFLHPQLFFFLGGGGPFSFAMVILGNI